MWSVRVLRRRARDGRYRRGVTRGRKSNRDVRSPRAGRGATRRATLTLAPPTSVQRRGERRQGQPARDEGEHDRVPGSSARPCREHSERGSRARHRRAGDDLGPSGGICLPVRRSVVAIRVFAPEERHVAKRDGNEHERDDKQRDACAKPDGALSQSRSPSPLNAHLGATTGPCHHRRSQRRDGHCVRVPRLSVREPPRAGTLLLTRNVSLLRRSERRRPRSLGGNARPRDRRRRARCRPPQTRESPRANPRRTT
jgi:hypothetical protein